MPEPDPRPRQLRQFEQMEPRCLLAADLLHVGAVYIEEDLGSDVRGDTFEIAFVGGAAGTQLTQVTIDGDRLDPGFGLFDVFFDTASSGLGADSAFPLGVVSLDGVDEMTWSLEDGGTLLTLDFTGFDAGDRVIFSVDVDEVQELDPVETDLALLNEGFDPITSGVEFQGSLFSAQFSAPNYFDAKGTWEFRNRYDDQLALAPQLDLPEDDVDGKRDRTAGTIGPLQQNPIPASISGFVYHDQNDNGHRDIGEVGIGGVRVQVVPIDTIESQSAVTVMTRSNGFYEATGLIPGTYRVVELDQPFPYLDGSDESGAVNGVPRGFAVNPGDQLEQIRLDGGEAGVEYNFGEVLPVAIHGRVHLSEHEEDCFDTGASNDPIEGATVHLVDASGTTIDSTTTDANGEYRFAELRPGTYRVVEETPVGLISGASRQGVVNGNPVGTVVSDDIVSEIVLSSGQIALQVDFCEHPPAELSGHVYHDRDDDGRRETGEEGIDQVLVILLDADGEPVTTQTTDEDGFYKFTGLRAGDYSLVEEHPLDWLDGQDAAGTIDGLVVGSVTNPGDRIRDIALRWGDDGVDYDFGELLPASLSGRVHVSTQDGDCFGDQSDHRPIEGAVIRLLDASGHLVAETTTDANGEYAFAALAPGRYSVVEITPDGLIDGGAHAGTVDGLAEGNVVDAGRIGEIALLSNQQGVNFDFCEHEPAMISGYVYHDLDDDGLRDASEDPISGVEILLKDASGNVIDSTRTDDLGFYKFRGLRAGEYQLMEMHPDGWLDGTDVAGIVDGRSVGSAVNPGDEILDIDLRWGDNGEEYDFAELLPATIAGLVHTEVGTRDCTFDLSSGEIALEGVRIQLIDVSGELVDETLTDVHGRYRFEGVAPGEYTIRQIQPRDYFNGDQVAGSHGGDDSGVNEITTIVAMSAQELVHYNFCEETPVTLSGYVFQDGAPVPLGDGAELPERIRDVRDGQRTSDDTPLAGVVVELRDGFTAAELTADRYLPGLYADGVVQMTTDANGFYEFTGLLRGSYSVYESQPEGFIDGVDIEGSASGLVFNPGEPLNTNALALLEVDPQFDAIVRINLAPGTVSVENNFSEVKTVADPPIPLLVTPPLNFTLHVPNIVIELPNPDPPALANYKRLRFGDGSAASGVTWHLSVIDAGHPRGPGVVVDEGGPIWFASARDSMTIPRGMLKMGEWTRLRTGEKPIEEDAEKLKFGLPGAIPVTGDFDGDGFFEIGVFFKGEWFIDINGNGVWDQEDLWAKLGHDGDMPVTGDWDGDGKHDIGIFGPAWPGDPRAVAREPGLPDRQNRPDGRRKNVPPDEADATSGRRLMKLTSEGDTRADLIDHVFHYGLAIDYPVTGDWNGDGIASVGVFRDGRWHIDLDGNGRWSANDEMHHFGQSGDIPVVGDFDGDGVDDIGIFRAGVFYLDTNGNREIDSQDEVIKMGQPTDKPVAGDWDGDGIDEVAVYRDGEPAPDAQARKAG